MAGMIQEVAIGYEVYRMTHDPFALGMIGLVEAVPFMSFTLFGGHIADVHSKRSVLMWSVGGIALSSIGLQVVMRMQYLLSMSSLLVAIYASLFVIGLCRAFQSPTTTSLRAILVTPEVIENASTWGSTSWQLGAILGPAAAGFLYAGIGFTNTLLLVTFFVVFSFILFSRIQDRQIVVTGKASNILASIKEGIHFVFSTKSFSIPSRSTYFRFFSGALLRFCQSMHRIFST